jgi:hypothetical protein
MEMKTKLVRRILIQIGILSFSVLCMAAEETWTEVKSPNFIIVSNASRKQAGRTAKLFEQFRLLIQTVMVDSKADPSTPLIIFAAKDEKSFNTLLAEEKQEKGIAKRAGWFLPGPEQNLVILRIDAPEDETYHVIYHEYVHLITRLNYGRLPLWLEEGIAEFFAYSELADNLTYVGKVKSGVIESLRSKPLIPLSTLLAVTHDSPYYREEEKTSIFYRQSWALAHYLIIGDNRAHSKQLMSYIGMIRNGVSEQDAAKNAFGDLKALETALNKYIQRPTTGFFEVPANLTIKDDQYASRVLSPAESLALRGELLVFRNHPDRAKTLLEQALAIDPKNALANEALGQLFLRLNDREQARKYFAAAADLDSQSCMANFYAAQAIVSQNGDPDAAEKYLRKAIAINPEFAPANSQLSQVLRRKAKLPEALEYAKKAEYLQPGVLSHKINVAGILASMDQIDEAYEYGRHVAAIARDENDLKQAESFMTYISKLREQKLQMKRRQEEAQERMKQETERRAKLVADEEPVEDRAADLSRRRTDDAEKKRKDAIANLSSIKPGPAVRIEGIVKSVKCESPAAMEVVLENAGRPKTLYSDDNSKVGIKWIGTAKKDFQACRDLEGKSVEIEYSIISPSEYFSGLIKSITMGKK